MQYGTMRGLESSDRPSEIFVLLRIVPVLKHVGTRFPKNSCENVFRRPSELEIRQEISLTHEMIF